MTEDRQRIAELEKALRGAWNILRFLPIIVETWEEAGVDAQRMWSEQVRTHANDCRALLGVKP